MKLLLTISILIFSGVASANFATFAQKDSTRYTTLKSCQEKNPGVTCFDFSGVDPRTVEVKQVFQNDTDKPIMKAKYNMTACNTAAECGEAIDALNLPEGDHSSYCDQGAEDMVTFSENSLMPGWSFYCTSVIGYEQTQVESLVVNNDLKAQFAASDQIAQAKQSAKDQIEKNILFARDLKKEISIINLSRGLTTTQIQTFVDSFESINRLLDAGAIQTARVSINGLTPDGTIMRAEDKTAIIALIDKYLADNPQ